MIAPATTSDADKLLHAMETIQGMREIVLAIIRAVVDDAGADTDVIIEAEDALRRAGVT